MMPQPTPAGSPDATPEPAATGWVAPTELGRAQQVLATQPHLVAAGYALAWYPNAALLADATAQQAAVLAKGTAAGQRPALTKAKETAIQAMSQPLTELRGVMKKKFKEGYEAYYPQFGLVKSGKNWVLPHDHDDLIVALREKLLPALRTYGFGDDADTGTAVWQPLLAQLSTAQTQALGTDTARSSAKTSTDPQDAKLEKALRCVVHLLQAHHPDDWEDTLRGWGWRKTSF